MDKQDFTGEPPQWKSLLVVSEAYVTSDRSWSTPAESPNMLRTHQLQALRLPIISARLKHGKIPPSPEQGARRSRRKCDSLVHWHQSSRISVVEMHIIFRLFSARWHYHRRSLRHYPSFPLRRSKIHRRPILPGYVFYAPQHSKNQLY